MKLETVIEDRLPRRRIKEKKNKVIIALLILTQTVINQIVPFMLGVYFAITGSGLIFAMFVFMLFIELRVEIDKKDNIKIKIIKGI